MRKICLLANLGIAFGLAAPPVLSAESGLIFDQVKGSLTGQLNVSSNIAAAGSVTASSATLTNTAGAGLTVSSSAYLAVSGGNVGIGTTSTGAKLEVAGDLKVGSSRKLYYSGAGTLSIQANDGGGWANSYSFLGSAGTNVGGFGVIGSVDALTYLWAGNSYDNPTMVWKSGNVGIGTTGPAEKLAVAGNISIDVTNVAGVVHRGTVNGSNGLQIAGNTSANVNDTYPGASILVGGGTLTDTYEGNIDLTAYGGVQDSPNRNVIRFNRRTGVNTVSESVRIDGSGNVGIGTVAPVGKLHVVYPETNNPIFENTYGSGLGLNRILIKTRLSGYTYMEMSSNNQATPFSWVIGMPDSSDLFRIRRQNSDFLSITNTGNVGIGTTAPGQLLEVAGKLKLGDDASAPGAGTLKWVGKTLLVYDGALWKSSSGWAFQAVTVGSAYGAAAADSYCRSTYGAEWRLLVPRTAEHLRAAWDFVGGDAGYLTILAIYPRTTGNTCVSTAITSFTCTAWHAYDDGPYWVGTKTTITEPNGDNCPTCSMNYSWNSDGTISAYNDVPAGYTSAKFICMLDHP